MTTPDALKGLRTALSRLADALESWQSDRVLASETNIASAAHALSTCTVDTLVDLEALRRELIELRMLVGRCQSLGAVASQLETAMFPAGYGATGARLRTASPPTIASRT